MASYYKFLVALSCLLHVHTLVVKSTNPDFETYIVHVEPPPSTSALDGESPSDDLQGWYQTFMPSPSSTSSTTDNDEEPRILYSYHNVFKGFAARLSPEQAKAMETKPGFISAQPQKKFSLHTTHSPNFLGLNRNAGSFWSNSNYGRGVIIGVLDTGVNPLHPSFSDDSGMPPPPARWRGACQLSPPLRCNNKLIGARSFTIGNGTPLDEDGHGTHTASTAAGSFVRGASVFGNANGTAAGTAPLAHVATYKVCLPTECSEIDIVAAIDAAIDDGVDVLSLSLGVQHDDFYSDNVAVGTFSAFERGIFVSASAGNSGPRPVTIENGAPWILTVGASSVDRKITATAVLGDGQRLDGESTFQPPGFSSTPLPLVYPGAANSSAAFCSPESLANADIRGKIVVCDDGVVGRIEKGRAVRDAGGAGMILVNLPSQGYTTISDSHVLPATHLSYVDGLRVKTYLNTTSSSPHTAGISFGGTRIGDTRAPEVASFSARGPNLASLGILKPDIIGPGHNILAAWHVSVENNPNTNSNFNIISGTSMSCPHLSGVAALLKNAHPDWSPSAIKSAMMTTADQVNLAGDPIVDQTLRPASVLATGSGHVNVLRAANPGLVYDIRPVDYLPYLCGLGYSDAQVGIIVNRRVSCAGIGSISETELNYPSFSVVLGNVTETYNRTVTNVGEAGSVYTVETGGLPGVDLRVEPTTLRFSGIGQNLTYRVSFTLRSSNNNVSSSNVIRISEGFLRWSSAAPNRYSVRSPISVLF